MIEILLYKQFYILCLSDLTLFFEHFFIIKKHNFTIYLNTLAYLN